MRLAEAFHPGEFLRDELAERGLSAAQFAEKSGVHLNSIIEILNGSLAVNTHAAFKLGRALGTSPELWANLQKAYDDWHAHKAKAKAKAK